MPGVVFREFVEILVTCAVRRYVLVKFHREAYYNVGTTLALASTELSFVVTGKTNFSIGAAPY